MNGESKERGKEMRRKMDVKARGMSCETSEE